MTANHPPAMGSSNQPGILPSSPASRYRLAPELAAQIRCTPPCNMSVLEAAEFLGISPRKLRDLIALRSIKHARAGAKIIIRREWLEQFLEA